MKSLVRRGVALACIGLTLGGAQVFYAGWINPNDMRKTADGSRINLPFRLGELELNYAFGDFELRTRSALESRWNSLNHTRFQLREAYMAWYPVWGEFKLGNQIHAWGLADGNNPTDNLNPYDYYYLFLTGIDRKRALPSASVTIYLGDWELEGVYLPESRGNRLPYNEPDFPLPLPPKPEHILARERTQEGGLRLKTACGNWDWEGSWFHGNDRALSLQGANFILGINDSTGAPEPMITPYMGYNVSDAVGGGFVWFPGDFTVRGEGMWVTSRSPANDLDWQLQTEASYLQYVLQGEVDGPLDLTFMFQYLGTRTLTHRETQDTWLVPEFAGMLASNFAGQKYRPGLGTPFAIIAENGLMSGATGSYWDGRLEVRLTAFKDLDHVGLMAGAGFSYSPVEAWSLDLDGVWFSGDKNDPENRFTQLEDFSNLRIGLKYSF